MKLKELLNGFCPNDLPSRFASVDIQSISSDSRNNLENSLFVALKGSTYDGALFIPEAIKKGAKVIAVNKKDRSFEKKLDANNICILRVKETKILLRDVLQRFYNYPSRKVRTIGITGTNGKTTTSYLLESVFKRSGKRCSVIGTVNYRIGQNIIASQNTTPGMVDNQRYLADMVNDKMDYCIMEVSSHALDQGRVEAIDFCCGVFTNLTGDHLDYHRTIKDYFIAKSRLFIQLHKDACAIINSDDKYARRLIKLTKAKVITYGLNDKADVTAKNISLNFSGSRFRIKSPKGAVVIETSLIGRHNVYNILSAAAACLSEGMGLNDIKQGIEDLTFVPGRLEQIDCGQNFYVFVDYAHTEDALQSVLENLKAVSQSRIILVFGCGGDRDKTKRPKMGRVASRIADFSIVTSDNPRSEDPQSIVSQIISGFKQDNYKILLDRKEAIHHALSLARRGDIVLIAGKGHETYQILKDKTINFDDRTVVREYF